MRTDTQGISDQQEFWVCVCFPCPSYDAGLHYRDALKQKSGGCRAMALLPLSGQDVVEATGCLFRKEVLLCEAESPPNSAQVAPGGGLSTAVKTPWTGSARSAENGSCHPLLAARLREASVPRVEGRILAQNCLLALTHTLPSGTTVC